MCAFFQIIVGVYFGFNEYYVVHYPIQSLHLFPKEAIFPQTIVEMFDQSLRRDNLMNFYLTGNTIDHPAQNQLQTPNVYDN